MLSDKRTLQLSRRRWESASQASTVICGATLIIFHEDDGQRANDFGEAKCLSMLETHDLVLHIRAPLTTICMLGSHNLNIPGIP